MIDTPRPAIRAVVSDGATETWYLRAGTGAPVLVLAADPGAREALLRSLAGHARVTAPEPPPGLLDGARAPGEAATFATWLRGFLEGLGVIPVAIVADESFGRAAREFALVEGDRVGSSVVVVAAAQGGTSPADATEMVTRVTGLP